MSALGIAAVFYGLGVFITVIFGLIWHADASWVVRRTGARAIFLAPLWPLVLVYLVLRAIPALWDEADWRYDA